MKFISEETIIEMTKKYVEIFYNKLGDNDRKKLNKYVKNCTGFSNYFEFIKSLFSSSEFHYPDLYNCDEEFIHSKYLSEVVVNSKSYMMFACWVTFGNFCPCISDLYILADIPCFAYYEFVDQTNTDGTVGFSMKAEKMYSCEIDKDDYPEWVNIMKKRDLLKLVPNGTKIIYNGNIE